MQAVHADGLWKIPSRATLTYHEPYVILWVQNFHPPPLLGICIAEKPSNSYSMHAFHRHSLLCYIMHTVGTLVFRLENQTIYTIIFSHREKAPNHAQRRIVSQRISPSLLLHQGIYSAFMLTEVVGNMLTRWEVFVLFDDDIQIGESWWG